ncbi:MAG: aspartate dehydrogenase [Rhodoblastus sp.]
MTARPVSQSIDDASASGRRTLRIALIGWGAIARRFAELIKARNGDRIAIVALCMRRLATPDDAPASARIVTAPEALAALGADLVIEAAGRDAVAQWGEAALTGARAFAVASTSAFCDDALLDRLLAIAETNGSQIVIPAGALAGVDGLAAASVLGLDAVTHSIVKPPAAWRGTEAEKLCDLERLADATVFFEGAAREAARRFPQNANVAVISALAGPGLDRTQVRLVADPRATRNGHSLHARGDFGVMDMTIENRPLATNPKSSEMTALNLVRMVENRFRPLAC